MSAKTLFDKIWDQHVVDTHADGTDLLYIDRHLIHEITSPQAFEGLRLAQRSVRRPANTLAVADHNVSTSPDRLADLAIQQQQQSVPEQLIALALNTQNLPFSRGL